MQRVLPKKARLLATLVVCASFLGLLGTASATEELRLVWSSLRWDGAKATATSTSGTQVPLGMDLEIQRDVEELLVGARALAAAVVVVDVESGQVLAASEVGQSDGSLLFDPIAPAASVFKLVTTAALFERSSIAPGTKVCTQGGLRRITRSHLTPATGPDAICAPFGHALGVSRNAAYAQLATKELMRSDLIEVGESLGFNSRLPLDASGRTGTLTVPYNDLEFARTAAGFENSRLSVFGGAQLALTVATGGLARPMHFRATEEAPVGELRVMSPRTARRLRKAMEVTIHSGTARDSFVNAAGRGTLGPIQVAGKTGTLRPEKGAPTSSWFVGFAPSNKPTVVVSVLLQNPERWHRKGHQVARDILHGYFQRHGVSGLGPRH